MAKKKASAKGRKPFKRKVTTITKDLVEKKETIKLEKGILNHSWVAREYNISVDEAKKLVKEANK